MVARVAFFDGQPGRFATGHRYSYVREALRPVRGFRGAYHIRDAANDRAVSISFFEDEESARAGSEAVEAARINGQFEPLPPTSVFFGEVLAAAP